MRKKITEKISKPIPLEVWNVFKKFTEKGYEIYLVGAGVRDLLRGKTPVDCDFTTNATPEITQKLFKNSYYTDFGTVGIPIGTERGKEVYEITTYRTEWGYSDRRRPDKVEWGKTLEEDLKRRDFTVNAVVIGPSFAPNGASKGRPVLKKNKWDGKSLELIDLFKGQEDFKNKIIRAVGEPEERFSEDGLRMMRAVRFAATLGFEIEKKTREAIKNNSQWLKMISKERIRDELIKIIMSERAAEGIEVLRELGLLRYIIPELEEGYKVSQNKHHIYDCYEHSLLSLKYAAQTKYNIYVRMAALFHDIGKPRTKRGEGPDATFYGHEIVGAKMTAQILNRLRYPRKDIEKIVKLVRYHLFYYNVDEVGDSSVRRLLRKVGSENVEELLQVRHSDRIGSGCPKAEPYKLRHLRYVMDKVSQDPVSVIMLKVTGNDVMETLKIEPGPKVGQALDILLGEVLDDPKKNERETLLKKLENLSKLSDEELKELATKARKAREQIEIKRDEMTKQKYWVT